MFLVNRSVSDDILQIFLFEIFEEIDGVDDVLKVELVQLESEILNLLHLLLVILMELRVLLLSEDSIDLKLYHLLVFCVENFSRSFLCLVQLDDLWLLIGYLDQELLGLINVVLHFLADCFGFLSLRVDLELLVSYYDFQVADEV